MTGVAIIGGGAAGCFCAIELARRQPDFRITVLEAGPRPLAKVAVTGGGRCNFTNTFEDVRSLRDVYPRGEQAMKRALKVFSHEDTVAWFAAEGVPGVVQDGGCVFPKSQDAMQIVRTLLRLMEKNDVEVRCRCKVTAVRTSGGGFEIEAGGSSLRFDRVVVTTGGGASPFLAPLPVGIVPPVPSLFTLRVADSSLRSLMGCVVPDAVLRIAGTPFRSEGTLLLTDWGVSGPATLKLTSYAARHLSEHGYRGTLLVGWTGTDVSAALGWIAATAAANPKKLVSGVSPDGVTSRLWKHLVARAGIPSGRVWAELGKKGADRLAAVLTADTYAIEGRCRFKEEFVTCGGVALSEVSLGTLESRAFPGLYFAGEALDIDAVTGGFNLQAAWSTAITVARSIAPVL